jgi:hypothetical protein
VKKRNIALVIFSVLLIAGAWFSYVNRQYIKDYYVVSTTDLSAGSTALGSRLALTDDADFIYQASQTELQDAAAFRESCKGLEQQNIVLGCYTDQRAYIYNITEKQLAGIREVTAAHELLHATYERLSDSEKKEVNKLLDSQSKKLKNSRIEDTLKLYEDVGAADFYSEMYAIFGTEVKTLSSKLESHYAQFFENRFKIVAFSDQYQATFTKLQNQRDSYDLQLKQLKAQIDSLQSTIDTQKGQLDSQQAELSTLRNAGKTELYNQKVPIYNLTVQSYNSNVNSVVSLVDRHNIVVKKRNTIVVTENDLVDQLDTSNQIIQ